MLRDRDVTTYQKWQHNVTRECWVVRIESDTITGIFGPLPADGAATDPNEILFEDHPDDLEWIYRYSESFTVLPRV